MEKYLIRAVLLVSILVSTMSCEKEKVSMFDQDPGIYFIDASWSYSFIDKVGVKVDTLRLSAKIFGNKVNNDRQFTAKIIENDTSRITTLPLENYKIINGFIPADSVSGILEVEVRYRPEMDDSLFYLCLEIVANEDFRNVDYLKKKMKIAVTNKLVAPANWNYISNYFGGTFSTSWWKFVMEVTGKSSFPYNPYHPDQETWWMSGYEVQANGELVRYKLEQYNAMHPEDELTHSDGPKAKEPVRM